MSESTKYKYTPSDDMLTRLKTEFTYHSPKDDQAERYVALRDLAHALAIDIVRMTPPSREQSLALTKLGECVMHANSAIARNE